LFKVNVNPKEVWEIVGELGDGAFGKVEKAVSRSGRSLFAAAKAIEVQEGEELEDFLVEIDILTSCKHVNIVNLYACYFFENKLHMMLEFCGGGAVDAIMIELEKPLTEKQIAYVARYTCEAIAFLHDNNVIHRDLKAGNILLTSDAVVKLADFGVSAKLKDRNERRDTFIGTPYWMAPEVMMCETFKDQPYGTKSDIWSFGITLIEMAQMEPPHSNKSAPPTLENPSSWSIFFADFLSQCLVKNPAERKTAKQILSHPFIANATDRHPVLALLAEVNADIEEEVVIDEDRASCDESCADSEDQSSVEAMWTNPTPVPPPVKDVAVATTDAPTKKRAAPPPPPIAQPTTTPTQTSDMNKELFVQATTPSHPSKTPNDLVSPGREALNILDDLTTALDQQNSSSMHSITDGPISSETPQVAPNLVTVHSPVAEHKIRDGGSMVSSSENVYRQDSLHKAESHQSVQDKSMQDKTVVKLGINIPHEKELGDTTFAVRKHPHRQTVTKKTRTYTIDGMQVTSTTMHVLGTKEDMQMRKQQLQDLRRLQREEARQKQELQLEGANLVEQQERKFQQEKAVLTRQYEIDMEALERKQKREIEEAEKVQEDELKQAQKRLKYEQEKMAALERQFLMQKHLLLRAKENSDWELEEKQMGEKYVLHRKLFKDEYFLLRTQMLARHQKELAQAQKFNQEEEEELVRALALDRKKLPKMLRNEAKTRSHMFKESLRISMQSMTPAEMSEKLRRFDEQENMRIRNALEEHDMKSARKIAQLKEKHQFSMNELDEMQNEKRKQLLEKERNTMQEHEKKYYSMREQWQADLAPRKLMLESRFQEEMEAQERFYGISLSGTIASTPIMPGRMH
ncbi:kinase domain protein, partial [Teladorsagia circumcincta]